MCSDDLNLINAHLKASHVECCILPSKGRILRTTRQCKPGEVVITEPLLVSVSEPDDHTNEFYKSLKSWKRQADAEYETFWYWCALSLCLTSEENDVVANYTEYKHSILSSGLPFQSKEQRSLCDLFFAPETQPDQTSVSLSDFLRHLWNTDNSLPEVRHLLLNSFSAERIMKYTQIWVLNCFEGGSDPVTYQMYFCPTFISHSCLPNTIWHVNENDEFVLRTRSILQPGEEISFSYLAESGLMEPTVSRREELKLTKHFLCECERCLMAADFSRGFRCPRCQVGQMFLGADRKIPQGCKDPEWDCPFVSLTPDAMDAIYTEIQNIIDLISTSGTKVPVEDIDNNLSTLTLQYQTEIWPQGIKPYTCTKCSHKCVASEIAKMLALEKKNPLCS